MRFTVFGEIKDPEKAVQAAAAGAENARDAGRKTDPGQTDEPKIENMSVVIVGGLFTSTVSHKMVKTAVEEAKKKKVEVVRCHTSSASALESILKEHVV